MHIPAQLVLQLNGHFLAVVAIVVAMHEPIESLGVMALVVVAARFKDASEHENVLMEATLRVGHFFFFLLFLLKIKGRKDSKATNNKVKFLFPTNDCNPRPCRRSFAGVRALRRAGQRAMHGVRRAPPPCVCTVRR